MFTSMAEKRRFIYNSNKVLELIYNIEHNTITRRQLLCESIWGSWKQVFEDINLNSYKYVVIHVE